MDSVSRLLPDVADPLTAPFWEAARAGQVVIQHCAVCDNPMHPPRLVCASCRSVDLEWRPVRGVGTVWSYVIPHAPVLPAFADEVPFVVGVVALDGMSVRLVGRILVDADATDRLVSTGLIDARVEAAFQSVGDVSLVNWRLCDDALIDRAQR